MQTHLAEIAAGLISKLEGCAPSRPTNHGTTQRSSLQDSKQTLPAETHPADAFLRARACRHDQCQSARSNAPVFHKADSDFLKQFQTIRIAVTRAGSVPRSARPQRSDVPI